MPRGSWLVIGLLTIAVILALIAVQFRKSVRPVEKPIDFPTSSATTDSA